MAYRSVRSSTICHNTPSAVQCNYYFDGPLTQTHRGWVGVDRTAAVDQSDAPCSPSQSLMLVSVAAPQQKNSQMTILSGVGDAT